SVFAAQQIFEQDAQREGKFVEMANAFFLQVLEPPNLKALRPHVQRVAGAKRVSRRDGHSKPSFQENRASMITEFQSPRGRLYCKSLSCVGAGRYSGLQVSGLLLGMNIILISTYELGRQ